MTATPASAQAPAQKFLVVVGQELTGGGPVTGSGPVVVTSATSYTLLLPGGQPVLFNISPVTVTSTEALPQLQAVEGGTGPYTSTQVTQFRRSTDALARQDRLQR